jgi:hypothetical protein
MLSTVYVTDIVRRFEKLEMESTKARKDKDMLHSIFQQLRSAVQTKDEVIQGLRDRYNSAIRDLSAEKLQLKAGRQRLATVNKDLNAARDLAQSLQGQQERRLTDFNEKLIIAAAGHDENLERVQSLAIQQFHTMHDQLKEEISQLKGQSVKTGGCYGGNCIPDRVKEGVGRGENKSKAGPRKGSSARNGVQERT